MHPPLPEEQHTAGQRQPLPGWPVIEPAEIVKAEDRQAMGLYADPHGPGFVQVTAADLEAFRAATLAALQPPPPARTGLDPRAQIILATGAAAPLVGWGGALLFNALAGATTALGLIVVALLLARMSGGRGRGGDTYNTHVRQGWFSRNTTRN